MSNPVETPGAMARAALQREAQLAAATAVPAKFTARAIVPLLVEPGAHGSARLVHAETGEVLGQCVSEEIANGTRKFLT